MSKIVYTANAIRCKILLSLWKLTGAWWEIMVYDCACSCCAAVQTTFAINIIPEFYLCNRCNDWRLCAWMYNTNFDDNNSVVVAGINDMLRQLPAARNAAVHILADIKMAGSAYKRRATNQRCDICGQFYTTAYYLWNEQAPTQIDVCDACVRAVDAVINTRVYMYFIMSQIIDTLPIEDTRVYARGVIVNVMHAASQRRIYDAGEFTGMVTDI